MASLPPHDSQTRIATSPLVEAGPFLASVGFLIAHHNEQPVRSPHFGFPILVLEAWRAY